MADLFQNVDWHDFVEHNKAELFAELRNMGGNRLLNTADRDLIKYLCGKYWFAVPVLLEDEITVSQDRSRNRCQR